MQLRELINYIKQKIKTLITLQVLMEKASFGRITGPNPSSDKLGKFWSMAAFRYQLKRNLNKLLNSKI